MDGQPEVVSFGSRWGRDGPGRGLGRRRWIAVAAAVLLGCAGVIGYLGSQVAHRDGTISTLRSQLRAAHSQTSATAVQPVLPATSGSALTTFPEFGGGRFDMVAASIHPRPGSASLTWLFVYGQHATPGEHYGLLQGTCGGQYVTPTDLTDATANHDGDLTLVAPNLNINPHAADVWVLVYRWMDGSPLGGVQGPLIGHGDKPFLGVPPC